MIGYDEYGRLTFFGEGSKDDPMHLRRSWREHWGRIKADAKIKGPLRPMKGLMVMVDETDLYDPEFMRGLTPSVGLMEAPIPFGPPQSRCDW